MKKLPILILMLTLFGVLYFELHSYFTFESLKQNHEFLLEWTHAHPLLSGLIFTCVYLAIVAVSLPVAVYLNITAGFLFGIVWGTIFAVTGATLGAILIFLAVNTAFGKWLEQKAKGWLKDLEKGFQKNAFNYLLAIRLIPVIPFWAVNIGAALFNIRLKPFIIATFFGIIPETALYTWMGSGLEGMIRAGQSPSWDMFLTPSTLIPLLALPILPLIPLIYHALTKKRKKS
jgi:uncharacterized membrane protein YdjX (TVP38/TMEM64 family)